VQWIIVAIAVLVILGMIFSVMGRVNRAAKAKQLGLVKCPQCGGRGYISGDDMDGDGSGSCPICKDSPVRGYVTPQQKNRYRTKRVLGYLIAIVIAIIVAVLLFSDK
jgi:hypothetical protein